MNSQLVSSLTGAELRSRRRAMGINQTNFGKRVGISRHGVGYWEAKSEPFHLWNGTPARLAKALRIKVKPRLDTSTHARGDGVLFSAAMDALIHRQLAAMLGRIDKRTSTRRVVCGAKTRPGHPCRNKSEPGRRRCKFHGGKSTGPKTADGRARISSAQKARWARAR